MTPLDRILESFPGSRELLSRLDEYLPLIVVGSVVLLIALVFYWTFVAAPRRAVKIIENLDSKGYSPVDPQDPQLNEALQRLTPILFHTYELSTVTETSPWRVKVACARYDGGTSRYIAMINRSVSRVTRESTRLEHQFTIAFLERRTIPVSQDIHIAGDRYTLDPDYGLVKVPDEVLGVLSSAYVVHTRDGTLDALPAGLEDALMASAPALSIQAAKMNEAGRFLFHARLRFAPEGWALISNEYVCHQRKMDAVVDVADRISRSLA
jgi:hypothetical protein